MYQPDSWFLVLFELILVGSALYNSLKLTRLWKILNDGTRVQIQGAQRAPSVATYFSLNSNVSTKNKKVSSRRVARLDSMGDVPESLVDELVMSN
ncbi:unnamed protein product [Caenorhabditis angaria]|uniref:Uncharacterized protein n=1 Tax=Caenorhabditis angaria TaxID=860376 RepID=A0A9P1N1L1_9PELO|nr:unnamed protein product [Caenorhabditis angaria]